jgi:hypothetical protein
MIKGKYKRLVVYGCSFTAGDELGDSLVLGMPEEEVDLLKRNGISRQELYGKLHSECIRAGKTLTWARWLADHYNVPYSNRAQGGGSLQQMVYRMERDYHNGMTHEDDLVIVGLTSMFRWFQFSRGGRELSWVFNTELSGISELNQSLVEYYVTPQNIIWNYHLYLNYMQMLADKRKNIFAVNAISPFSKEKAFTASMQDAELSPDFIKTVDGFEYPFVMNPKYGMGQMYSHLPVAEATHGYGHPKVKYHKEFAKLVAEWVERLDD